MNNADKYRRLFTTGNIYLEPYDLLKKNYPKKHCEVWESKRTISLFNTPAVVGSFNKSDIILVYSRDTNKPDVVTERIYRKNYSLPEWVAMNKRLREKVKNVTSELGFRFTVRFGTKFIDCIHYREEWFRWVRKQKQ